MTDTVIQLLPSDVGVLPEPSTPVHDWLASLPPRTLLLVTFGEGIFRTTIPYTVEDVIDGYFAGAEILPRVFAGLLRATGDETQEAGA